MTFGVTVNGFIKKTEQEIIEENKSRWKDLFGQDQDLSDDSPNSILIGLLSNQIASLWETAEDVYNSLNVNSSSGVSLDNTCFLTSTRRKAASFSTANVSFKCDNFTTIPELTQIKQSSTGLIFETNVTTSINQNSANLIIVNINDILNLSDYAVYVNGKSYMYTSDSDATLEEIIDGLKNVIESAQLGLVVTNDNGKMVIEASDKNDTYNFDVDNKMIIEKAQGIIEVTAIELGDNQVSAESINEISQAISGLDSVINYYEGFRGSDLESDQDLRFRRTTDVAVSGFNFAEAIRARLLDEVPGVDYCKVYENDTLELDENNVEPKTYEPVIEGGSEKDIGDKLLVLKTAGMKSSGSESVEVTDSNGIPILIKFTRPTNVYIWLEVNILSYNDEESFPSNGDQAIIDEIISFSEVNFDIGDLIAIQKFYNPVFNVPGIGSVEIKLGLTNSPTGTPDYSNSNINLSIREKPIFNSNQITVNL